MKFVDRLFRSEVEYLDLFSLLYTIYMVKELWNLLIFEML